MFVFHHPAQKLRGVRFRTAVMTLRILHEVAASMYGKRRGAWFSTAIIFTCVIIRPQGAGVDSRVEPISERACRTAALRRISTFRRVDLCWKDRRACSEPTSGSRPPRLGCSSFQRALPFSPAMLSHRARFWRPDFLQRASLGLTILR